MTDHNAATALNAAVHEHRGLVQSVSYELSDIADACSLLGLDRVAKSLTIAAKALDESADAVVRAHSEAIYANLAESEQATTNMMRGILAGIDLGSKASTITPA